MDHLLPLVTSHLQKGIPIQELACSERDKSRLRAIISCWHAYCRNPFTSPTEWFTHKEKNYISPEFLPTALAIFEHIRHNFEAYDSKTDKDMVKWAARTAMRNANNKGNDRDLVSAGKLLLAANNGFAEESEDHTQSRSALPIVLVHATTKNPESIDYTDFALEEEMRKWNAAIDPHFLAINDRVRQLEQQSQQPPQSPSQEPYMAPPQQPQQPISVPTQEPYMAPQPSQYLTEDLFDEYEQ